MKAAKAQRRAAPADDGVQVFRLYVTAASPISARAIVNARRFMELRLPGAHRLEVLDIAENVPFAIADEIIASPTLVRISPLPARRFIGDLSDVSRLETALGLPEAA
jgi:circadian clock protein KaiB